MPRGSTCKAKGCTANKNDNPELSFHSFPRNKERFKLWCDLIQRPDLNHGKAITSRMSMRVCSLHFEDRMYMNPKNKSRLIWCAVPKRVEVEGDSSREKAESDADLDDPESYNASSHSGRPAIRVLNPVTDRIQSSVCDSEEDLNDSVVPSEGSLKALIQRKNDCNRQRTATNESRIPLKAAVGGAVDTDQDQDHLISSKTPNNTLSCLGHESRTSISLGTTAQDSKDKNMTYPSKTSLPMRDEFPHSSTLQERQPSSSSGPMRDTVRKREVEVESASESEKGGWNEDHGCNRYFAAEASGKTDGAAKSVTWRTYPGPIQRRVVRTKTGVKRTIMIVKKASLKNLQAKGLIRPIRKYVASHIHGQQTVKKRNVIQYNLSNTNHLLKCSSSGDLVPRKGEESERKNSLVIIRKHNTDEQNCLEPDTKPGNEQHPSSHIPVDPQNPDKLPVTVSWANVNRSNTLSLTFTVELPAKVSTPASTAEQNPPQSETLLLNNGDHCGVWNSKTPTEPSVVDPDQLSSSHLSNNLSTSPKVKIKDSKDLVFGTTRNSHQVDAMPSLSPKYAVHSPVVCTQPPISYHEISSNHRQLGAEESYHSGRETSVTDDWHSFESMSLDGNVPTATQTQKHPDFQSCQDNVPGLSCKPSCGVKKHPSNNRSPEGDKTVGKLLTQTRPKNRENVQWIALPSISVSQPSPSAPAGQVENSESKRNNGISIMGLNSAEPPDVMYGALPLASLGQKGKLLHITPPFKSANKELKLKYSRLLNKHRHRYHLLLKKYKVLQKHLSAIKNAATPHQVIQDARTFLSEEHVLFLESQMFLRNRPGTGNRFSRKFMKLMTEYYRRSAAGYRFLRTIFTIPSVKTVQKWLGKPVGFRNLNVNNVLGDAKDDLETGIDQDYPPPKTKAMYTYQDSDSYENLVQNMEYKDDSASDYDSGESSLENFGIMEEDEQALNQLL